MKSMCRRASCLAVLAAVLSSCGGGGGGDPSGGNPPSTSAPPPSPSPPPSPPPASSPLFFDATSASNINYEFGFVERDWSTLPDFERSVTEETEVIAIGGAAAGDYDGDGDIDVFLTRGDSGPNLLYRNEGNLAFSEMAAGAGLAYTMSPTENYPHSGPTFADMDGDRDLDLFLGGLFDAPSMIFRNNGDGTFTDVTADSGIDTLITRNNMSAAFGDYDLDGDLDLFVSHWGTFLDRTDPGDTQHLWQNISAAGKIEFKSASVIAHISPSISTLAFDDPKAAPGKADTTFTPAFARINDDLHPDILSVADFNESMVFINNRDGTFTNATDFDVIIDDNGMGSALGDYDNDGDLDWFVSSIYSQALSLSKFPLGNRLYRNDGSTAQGVTFTDVSASAGVANGGWGWGACFIDFENDGDLDIYHTNGWPLQHPWGDFRSDRSRAFVSDGAGGFTEQAEQLGLLDTEQGRGVVCADFDDDGDTDILLLHMRPELSATLWENDAGNNYLRVRLRGVAPNTEAAGARIWARIGSTEQMREITIGSNFISQNPVVQIFGLGTSASVDELRIEWPNGDVTTDTNVRANQTYVADQPGLAL